MMNKLQTKPEIYYTWIMWLVVMCAIIVVSALDNFNHSVTGAYSIGAARWILGFDLYSKGIHGFLYLPHAAILYTPFVILPDWLGESLWRLMMMLSFVYGIYAISKELEVKYVSNLFTIASLVSLPMVLDSARNGQMTLMLTGLMLLATRDLIRQKYGYMVVWLMIGLALKPLILVLVLLIGGVYKETRWRLLVGLGVLFVGPMLMASPEYILQQYVGFCQKSARASDPILLMDGRFSDAFGMLQTFGFYVNAELQTIIRIILAVGVFCISKCVMRMWGRDMAAFMIFTFAICYLMLLNPRTEINTYSMFSVVLGIYAGWAVINNRQIIVGICLIVSGVLISCNYELVKHITPGREVWLPPLLTLVFVGYLLWLLVTDRRPVRVAECVADDGAEEDLINDVSIESEVGELVAEEVAMTSSFS